MSYEQFVGRSSEPVLSQDEVNVPMIRHWVEAMGDANPIYLDESAARATGRAGVIAPPTMLQAWTMRGYAASVAPTAPNALTELWDALAADGYTSVVATDCEQEYLRELVPGDRLTLTETVESISDEKRTGLGIGHFVTTVRTYTDQHGETVGVQRWRTLRFKPGTGRAAAPQAEPAQLRPRPAINRDNAFWFDAAREHRLVIQRCTACKQLRHPPAPCCPSCRSFEWDTVESAGRGTVHSFVVNHHPRTPGFEYPHVVVLVDLDEGVRLIANVTGVQPDAVRIGQAVELAWLDADPELTLPVFRPRES
ncbi:MAG TPA: bifunctional MaoC family dehydratase N-terminal/OB-fold nucleic acid binding domain-containing protein [Jatrophihabitantaceae bacterium]|nr:bifunctional MaoC family dehydratase N-terminal/OB-fold nucleic acid binding domain-containing protein [Jatrophihabitantaceae bacterium]